MTGMDTSRRSFLAGSGLVIGLVLPLRGRAATPSASFQPNAFVRVAPDNSVTVVIKHIEFGQGPSTGLATLVADELDADWAQMRTEMAPANDPLYKNLLFGTMATGGSTAIANSWTQMRSAGAAARAMLVAAAAKRWNVPAAEVKVSKGVVSHGRNKALFGELAAEAAMMPVPAKPVLKTPDQWTLIGTDVPKIDSATKSDGSAKFTMDIARPAMVSSAILHAPAFGGTVRSVDAAAAKKVPGVFEVQTIPQGVVVYARDTYSAMKGRSALKVDWDLSKAERRSSEAMYKTYAAAARTPGLEAEKTGDAAAALKGAARTVDAEYRFPFLAHAPMEPMDAVIERKPGGADVWMGSQFQVGDMRAIAGVLGVPLENVTLHQQYAGGSFGRRATPDMEFAIEAATIAKSFSGKDAVKHVWSRENDLTGGRYRPLVVHRVKAGLDVAGEIVAWDHVVAAQSFVIGTPMAGMIVKDGLDSTMAEGATEAAYGFPAHRVGVHVMPNGVPTLWWRSVGNTHTAFVMETMIDELATMAGKDPVAVRLALMKEARAKAVLTRAVELAGGLGAKDGLARGVAFHKSFGTYVAQVAEIERGPEGVPRVRKVWCAVDCGVAVNPNVIRAQMEGGLGYGLGHALYGELSLGEGGVVEQRNFDRYRSLRMAEMPAVEVAIIKSDIDPTGVGEPGLPPIAPAVANAWRKLTGKSVRHLPFVREENS